MKKLQIYETPLCELYEVEIESAVLSGSGYGTTGMPGSELDVLPGLDF